MNNKKLKNLLLLSAFAVTATSLAACNKNVEPSDDDKDSVTINEENKTMILGDTSRLVASIHSTKTGLMLTWSSTNSNVVSVDKEGYVIASNIGQANVVATYGDATAVCKVTVTSDIYTPQLKFVNDVDDVVNVGANTGLNLSTYIEFNGKRFDDAEVTYTISDPSVGSMQGTTFIAGDTIGVSTNVHVSAKWRGFSLPSLSLDIMINVISIRSVIINDGATSDIKLATIDKVGEETYKVVENLTTVKGYEDGVLKDVDSVVLEDTSTDNPVNLEWDSSTHTGKITSVKEGVNKLIVSFKTNDGSNYSQEFDIVVSKPTYKVSDSVPLFSIEDGAYYDSNNDQFKDLTSLFPSGTGEKKILEAYQGNKELIVDSEGKRVYGIISSTSSSVGTADVVLYNDKIGVEVTLDTYQKVVTKPSDFVDIFSSDAGKDVSGYYILGKNVVDKTNALAIGSRKPNTFSGIFDGNGHYISLKINHLNGQDEWGLFGSGLKGEIKNVAFYDCEMTGANAGFIAHHSQDSAKLSNVFIKNRVTSSSTYSYDTFYSTYGSLQASCVIIDSLYTHPITKWGSGALGVHRLNPSLRSNDLYFLTENEIGANASLKSYITQAEADADTEFTGAKHVLSSYCDRIGKYASVEAFKSAGLDFSKFSSDIWDTSSGIPVFKGLPTA